MMEKTDDAANFDLVLEQYKSLQAETQLRIGEYHKLLFFKMASCGALFSYVLAKESPSVLGSFLAPLLAVMVDFLIVNNLCIMGTAGHYIYEEIESRYFHRGWETVSGEMQFYGLKRYTWLTDWLIVIGSTLVIYGLTAAILVHYGQFRKSLFLWILIILLLLLLVADVSSSSRTLKVRPAFRSWLGLDRATAAPGPGKRLL